MTTKKNGAKKRTEYVCTSISFSPEDGNKIKPLSIPENNLLLDFMAKKLKETTIERNPLRKQNLGIKFSADKQVLFKSVKKQLKNLNISLSTFYKECYYEFMKKLPGLRKENKERTKKAETNAKVIKETADLH